MYHLSPRTTLKALYGQAFRQPAYLERELISSFIRLIPSADLKPEKIQTRELVWYQRLNEAWRLTTSAYSYILDDVIRVTLIDPTQPFVSDAQFQNIDQVSAWGVESEFSGFLRKAHQVGVSYSYQKTTQADPGAIDNEFAPAHLGKVRWAFQGGHWLSLGAEWFIETGRAVNESRQTDSVGLLNVHVTTRPFWYGLRASVRVNNALNTSYDLPAGVQHRDEVFRQDGRRVTAHLQMTF